MFSKILIANRGEIAVRIIRACKEMGISTVSVYSESDRDALHVSLADESICIGGTKAKDSYLNMNSIISAACVTKAEAIHPGYGFLSENHKFAEMCEKCGIVFIGPPSEVIASMGDKDAAKRMMRSAGVPVIPGCDLIKTAVQAHREADKIGYPLLIKARAGGGGRGIRKVERSEDVESSFISASNEARSVFGDGECYIEKYLNPVKHVEMQILCDNYGNVISLGERECSVQRKNQKLIEESPSPAVNDAIRAKMTEASVKAAKASGYRGAGTIEYLLDKSGNFYFMEMNTRLQVEHAVSEMVTGIDIVKWQIRIAAGAEITFTQNDIKIDGCAMECRINAEDPYDNFRPCAGKITLLHVPGGPNVRFDSALYQGYEIPPFYDSMIGKVIVCAKTREETIRKMQAALCELVVEGVEHNSELQMEILNDKDFMTGEYYTNFMTDKNLI